MALTEIPAHPATDTLSDAAPEADPRCAGCRSAC